MAKTIAMSSSGKIVMVPSKNYVDYATAMADVTTEGWTYGERAQKHLEEKGLL